MKETSDRAAGFFYELGILQTMKRSGQDYLGSGTQSIADHVFRTAMIGYTMAKMTGCDADKVLKMCMFHDLEESRTGDLNYLQQNYVTSDDEKALSHVVKGLAIEPEVNETIDEYAAQQSQEAILAKDADTLELIFFLKEQKDKGNQQADNWIRTASQRLKTEIGKELMQSALDSMYYEWWYNSGENWRRGNKNW
ncbi:HD domain-containing protein [Seleniivibrio woodruffii]|uniref:5'-deoxynucleotidase n=1 Tax=Seleniivibrio woodruffii TaxID=1078050 RepID=A0A4R1K7U4_9BACT|nr:HD domain-containing protein [Seleniivibrio woodruffii]TCK60376.1 metal dependent phosphohydrolase [Seleniivibrio woodruffii]TVZ36003.1 metal dependent phosphohydrolase [Seleniivibrio woodruffii]